MPRLLAIAGLRLLFCCAAAYGMWRMLGAVGLAVSAPLFGVLLARPLIDLSGELRALTRTLAYADVQGRHFEHRGIRFNVIEDEDHHRWVRVNDVRKVMPRLPREAVLRKQFPHALRGAPRGNGPVIEAEALLAYLAPSSDTDSVKFRNWLDREVVRPAATIRRRSGIEQAEPPDTIPSPQRADPISDPDVKP